MTFITTDGNKQKIYIDAPNDKIAKREFEKQYDYEEILKIEEIDE